MKRKYDIASLDNVLKCHLLLVFPFSNFKRDSQPPLAFTVIYKSELSTLNCLIIFACLLLGTICLVYSLQYPAAFQI